MIFYILKLIFIATLLFIGNYKCEIEKDLFGDPKFDILILDRFIPESLVLDILNNEEDIVNYNEGLKEHIQVKRMVLKAGKKEKFLCEAQFPIEVEESSDIENNQLSEADKLELKEEGIKNGLSLLQNQVEYCLILRQNWWTYKYCYKGEITQYHELTPDEEKETPSHNQVYVLGRYKDRLPLSNNLDSTEITSKSDNKNPLTNLVEIRTEDDRNFLVEKWGGGDLCDLTNEPRTVEIIYGCFPELSLHRINSIKEISTCNYQMVINNENFCKYKFFNNKKKSSTYPIRCSEIVKDEDLERREKEQREKAQQAKNNPELEGTRILANKKPKEFIKAEILDKETLKIILNKFNLNLENVEIIDSLSNKPSEEDVASDQNKQHEEETSELTESFYDKLLNSIQQGEPEIDLNYLDELEKSYNSYKKDGKIEKEDGKEGQRDNNKDEL